MRNDSEYINFCGFLIPVLPEFAYREDGLVKGPRILFVEDLKEILLITFEEGMRCIDDLVIAHEERGYEAKEYLNENKKLQIAYPCQSDMKTCRMGYFHVELIDEEGGTHILPGQMYVSHPDGYVTGIEAVPMLKELFYGVRYEKP